VYKLFPEEGYGFLKTPDGREIYFHRNSVLNNEYDRLEIGTGVRFVAEVGEKGLQASTVLVVDKPGVRISKVKEPILEPPLGWK
jgi:cold shock CspA family protein